MKARLIIFTLELTVTYICIFLKNLLSINRHSHGNKTIRIVRFVLYCKNQLKNLLS